MKLLARIENAINTILLKLGELMLKAVPAPVKRLWSYSSFSFAFKAEKAKKLPSILKDLVTKFIPHVKSTLTQMDFASLDQTASQKKLKGLIMLPFTFLGQWLNSLSTGQSILLLGFTSASFLAVIGIGFSGQKILNSQSDSGRAPASIEEDASYPRPIYYKKDERHVSLTNFRLPIYIPKVNGIRSVDIDFNATLSNRRARQFLEKHEFHLRDHLILQIEPTIATFPIQDEGKEILRLKLKKEINDFLRANNIEGEVREIKITYILAN